MQGIFVAQNFTSFDALINESMRNYVATKLILHFAYLIPNFGIVAVLKHNIVCLLVFVYDDTSVFYDFPSNALEKHLTPCLVRILHHSECQILEQVFLHSVFDVSRPAACGLVLSHRERSRVSFSFEVDFSHSLLAAETCFQPVYRDYVQFVDHKCVLLIDRPFSDPCVHLVELLAQLKSFLVTNNVSRHKWN